MGCCMLPLAVPGLFDMMWREPELFFPVGAGMGLVAFAIVRPDAPPRGA